ncbi:MAG: 5-formyltetrahydrofolate cyclo-ligase [Kiritimatiellia bacterium]
MKKELIRKEMRARRRKLTEQERKNAGKQICRNLMNSQKINLLLTSWRVSLYLSAQHEIPTRYISNELWNHAKEICVPTWDESTGKYILCAFLPGMPLSKGPLGIREPVERFPVYTWDVDAFIIPGLAFDLYGARLGFGAGFYDRILSDARPAANFIALCHDWQVIEDEQIPQECHDIRMKWIITEKRIIKCGKPPKHNRLTTV